MLKGKKISSNLIGIIFLIFLLVMFILSPFFKEAYCSTKTQIMRGSGFATVPITEADIKQVPNLGYRVGQKISWEFSKELECERQLKRFIPF